MALPLASAYRTRRKLRWRRAVASGRRDYNYFRDYDPATGRYLQPDPIGLAGGVSMYGYVGGSPLGGIDPYGLEDSRAVLYGAGVIDQMPNRSVNADFFVGAWSYVRGNYRAGRFVARLSGILGECEQERATDERVISRRLMDELAQNPELRAELYKQVKAYAKNHKAQIAGRISAGSLTTAVATRFAGRPGTVVGFGLAANAVVGDLRFAVESGTYDAPALAAAIAAGHIAPNQSLPDCGCR